MPMACGRGCRSGSGIWLFRVAFSEQSRRRMPASVPIRLEPGRNVPAVKVFSFSTHGTSMRSQPWTATWHEYLIQEWESR